jgi:hypothetical protein
MSQLTSNTQAFVHKEQYGKSTKKRKTAMKTMKKPMPKKKPMKKMGKPKKQGY